MDIQSGLLIGFTYTFNVTDIKAVLNDEESGVRVLSSRGLLLFLELLQGLNLALDQNASIFRGVPPDFIL